MEVRSLSVCDDGDGFAVVSADEMVMVFNSNCAEPIFKSSLLKHKKPSTSSKRLVFLRHPHHHHQTLFVLHSSNRLQRFDNVFGETSSIESHHQDDEGMVMEEIEGPSPLQLLYGSANLSQSIDHRQEQAHHHRHDDLDGLFSGSSHMMASLSSLFSAFISQVVKDDTVAMDTDDHPHLHPQTCPDEYEPESAAIPVADLSQTDLDEISSRIWSVAEVEAIPEIGEKVGEKRAKGDSATKAKQLKSKTKSAKKKTSRRGDGDGDGAVSLSPPCSRTRSKKPFKSK